MSNTVLAIDLGTQSTRAAVVTAAGAIRDIVQIPHETHCPQPGWMQQRPMEWWEETCTAIRNVLERTGIEPGSLDAVASCGQMHGPVGIDAQGDITTEWVQLWCDKRCAPQVEAIRGAQDETRLMQLAGNPLTPAWTGFKVRWEKENNTEAYRDSRWYLVPKDFINWKLTGIAATDPSEAGCSYLLDSGTEQYSHELAEALDIDLRKFPPVCRSHEIIGTVSKDAARQTGLLAGTPVVAGGGDFPVSMLGFGVVGEGLIADITGTSTMLAAHSQVPLVDTAIQNCHHVVDGWIPFTIIDCGGLSTKWSMDFARSFGGEATYDTLIEQAKEAPPGSRGLFFFPYMLGERRHENVNGRGGYFGITLDHDARHFVRSVMEGVAFAMGKDLNVFRKYGLLPSKVLGAGGGTRNALWNQIKSDIMQLPLEISAEPEAGLKGCALLGAAGVGLVEDIAGEAVKRRISAEVIKPNAQLTEEYEAAQEEFTRIYTHMLGFWR
jgi:xylulokinase